MRSRGEPAPPRPRPAAARCADRPRPLRPDRPRPLRPDRPAPDRPIRRPPKARRLIDVPPSEPLLSDPLRRAPRRGKAPREDVPRSQPRPGDFGPADRRSAEVSLVSEPPRENRGACPVRPPPAGLPRCRSGEARPRGADRPKTAGRPSEEEDLRLNTEPPSSDRPMLELPNLGMPSPVGAEPGGAEPGRAASDPGSRAAEQRAAEHALAATAAEPDPGRARAQPGRGERRAETGRGPLPGASQLELGLAPRGRPCGARAAQAADRARPLVPLGQPQPWRVSAGQLPDRALARARGRRPGLAGRPADPPPLAARACRGAAPPRPRTARTGTAARRRPRRRGARW